MSTPIEVLAGLVDRVQRNPVYPRYPAANGS
jgi:hypothetical protein